MSTVAVVQLPYRLDQAAIYTTWSTSETCCNFHSAAIIDAAIELHVLLASYPGPHMEPHSACGPLYKANVLLPYGSTQSRDFVM